MDATKKEHIVTILNQEEIASKIYNMVLDAPEIANTASPGQFVHIQCPDGFLRRPISICDCLDGKLRIIYRAEGKGTQSLSRLKSGDSISLLGPLGHGFTPVSGRTIVIGGGLGVFPLLYLSKQLENPIVLLGFSSQNIVCLDQDFLHPRIFTDDGTFGEKGFVTEGLLEEIKKEKPVMIYACGPTPMLDRVEMIAKEHRIDYEVSLEERMGCGVGACLVCNCERDGKYRRVCKDGPVFRG